MESGEYQTLIVSQPADGVCLVTLNRPDRLNAMTVTMFDELEQVVVDRYKLTDREKEQALEAFSALEGEDPAEGGQAPEAHADEA